MRELAACVAVAGAGAQAQLTKKKLKQQQICCILRGDALQVPHMPWGPGNCRRPHDCGKLTQYLEA